MIDSLAARVAELSPAEHGFSHFHPEARAIASGRLDGWLIPAKDLYDVAGMPTTHGSAHRTRMAHATDPFLRRLLAEGAVIPGKSAVPELGLTIHTEPVGLPAVDNPLYPGHTPGGSSGGAAAMVARGLVRAAHASDGGGSIRVPAAATGTVGFLPTHEGLSAQGFITTTVADQAFLHDIRPASRRLRVGVLTDPLFADVAVDAGWLAGLDLAAGALSDAGHDVLGVGAWPRAEETFGYFTDLFTSRMAGLDQAEDLAAWLREKGRALPPRRLADARSHAHSLTGMLAAHWNVDVLATPMLAGDPPPTGAFSSLAPAENFRAQTEWSPWASLANVAGTAAISIPWPRPGRPPVAVHLAVVRSRVSDAELLGLARELHG